MNIPVLCVVLKSIQSLLLFLVILMHLCSSTMCLVDQTAEGSEGSERRSEPRGETPLQPREEDHQHGAETPAQRERTAAGTYVASFSLTVSRAEELLSLIYGLLPEVKDQKLGDLRNLSR